MITRRKFIAAASAAAMLAAGCSSDPGPEGKLPDPKQLVADASKSAAKIKSTHFTMSKTGDVPGVLVNSVDGDMTDDGKHTQAKGTAQISMLGQTAQIKFVLTKGTLYIDGLPGGTQKFSESQAKNVYDFSAVLDPNRGIPKMVGSLKPSTVSKVPKVGAEGVPGYKVDGTVPRAALGGLVPQVAQDVKSSLLITDKGREPVQADAVFGRGDQAPKLHITLSAINKPVTIKAPKK